MLRLVGLVKPLMGFMALAIAMGRLHRRADLAVLPLHAGSGQSAIHQWSDRL